MDVQDSIIECIEGHAYLMTHAIKNKLRSKGIQIDTPKVLRECKRMEKAGLIERANTPYVTQIGWKLTSAKAHN